MPNRKTVLIISLVFIITACDIEYYPKPRGYFRIDLPEKNYTSFDSTSFPYSFQIPDYIEVRKDYENLNEPYWIDLYFKPFDATLHLSYKSVNKNLSIFTEDARTFVNKHIAKANAIKEKEYLNKINNVYGLVFSIEGNDVASPLQFYLTDSTNNYIRGALYFNFTPNNDSLEPVISFIKNDVFNLIETFKWKNQQ